jgi:hypothetical protein
MTTCDRTCRVGSAVDTDPTNLTERYFPLFYSDASDLELKYKNLNCLIRIHNLIEIIFRNTLKLLK